MTQEQDPIAMVVPPLADNYLSMVLLVDDQVLICEAVRRALADEPDIDLHYCTNSGDAVRTAQELKPTVILQDLVMPGIDGLDLLRTYRATPLLQAVPVIVLSAKDEASTKSHAFRAGANDYLVKLPDRIELIARIRHQTRAYLDHVQRAAAYNALRESQRQLMNANLELQRLTQIDGLTNLGNRRYFNEYMQAEWRRALRSEASIAVLMIDVDRFKGYNDASGHLEGDEVLKRLAAIINTGASSASDLAARFGGEEFIVVLPGATIEGASAVADRLVRSVRELSISHGDGFDTISVGVAAMVPSVGTSARDLVNAADVALFRAKEAGRDRVEPYDGN